MKGACLDCMAKGSEGPSTSRCRRGSVMVPPATEDAGQELTCKSLLCRTQTPSKSKLVGSQRPDGVIQESLLPSNRRFGTVLSHPLDKGLIQLINMFFDVGLPVWSPDLPQERTERSTAKSLSINGGLM